MQEQNTGPAPVLKAGFEDMHREAVAVVHKSASYAGRESPHPVGSDVSAPDLSGNAGENTGCNGGPQKLSAIHVASPGNLLN